MWRVAQIHALLAGLALLCADLPALAQGNIEVKTFAAFRALCITDKDQFARAGALFNGAQIMEEPYRSLFLQKRDGEAWLVSTAPIVAFHIIKSGGCGVFIKPVHDEYLANFLAAIPGQDVVASDSYAGSWSKWYLIDDGGTKGILAVGYLDRDGTHSINLRYLSAKLVVKQATAGEYLMLESFPLGTVRRRLGTP